MGTMKTVIKRPFCGPKLFRIKHVPRTDCRPCDLRVQYKHSIIVCHLCQSLGNLFGAQALLHRQKPLNRVGIWVFLLRYCIHGCADNMGTNNSPPEVTTAADNTLDNTLQPGMMSKLTAPVYCRGMLENAKYDRLWRNLKQWNRQRINISLILSNIVHVWGPRLLAWFAWNCGKRCGSFHRYIWM